MSYSLGKAVLVLPFEEHDIKEARVGVLKSFRKTTRTIKGVKSCSLEFSIKTPNKTHTYTAHTDNCLYGAGDNFVLIDNDDNEIDTTITSINVKSGDIVLTNKDDTYVVNVADLEYNRRIECYVVSSVEDFITIPRNDDGNSLHSTTAECGYANALLDLADYYSLMMSDETSAENCENNKIYNILAKLYPHSPSIFTLLEEVNIDVINAINFAIEVSNYKEDDNKKKKKKKKLTLDEIKKKLGYDFDLVEGE